MVGEVVTADVLSVAWALSEYTPAGTLLQANVYGAALTTPINVVPLKNDTLVIVVGETVVQVAANTTFDGATVYGNGVDKEQVVTSSPCAYRL